MKAVRFIAAAITACALALLFAGLGFLACILPPVTHGFSTLFAQDAVSPLDRGQLVRVADATRDYSFGDHHELALYQVIFEVDAEYAEGIEAAGGTVPADFPRLGAVSDDADVRQYQTAFAGASELYCYSPDTISHLDDCYAIYRSARTMLIVAAVLALLGLVFTGITGKKRWLGTVLMSAGGIMGLAFVGLGAWAAIDFTGFFTAFHQLFFAQQGNWEFPYDSLLICSLPEPFWMGMAVVFLVVAIVMAALSVVIGRKVRR